FSATARAGPGSDPSRCGRNGTPYQCPHPPGDRGPNETAAPAPGLACPAANGCGLEIGGQRSEVRPGAVPANSDVKPRLRRPANLCLTNNGKIDNNARAATDIQGNRTTTHGA